MEAGLAARMKAVAKLSLLAASMMDLSTFPSGWVGWEQGLRLTIDLVSSQRAWKWPQRKSWRRLATQMLMDSLDRWCFGPRISIST